jgi:hypothetical protein
MKGLRAAPALRTARRTQPPGDIATGLENPAHLAQALRVMRWLDALHLTCSVQTIHD